MSWHIFVLMGRASSIRQCHTVGARSGVRRPRISIDLRAQGPALEIIAQSRCMPLAALVRTALADWLAWRAGSGAPTAGDVSLEAPAGALSGSCPVKVTLRMPAHSAARLALDARAAERPQGLYVAHLVEGRPPMQVPADQQENRRALQASTATLAALCCDLLAFERGLRQVKSVDLAGCEAVIEPLAVAVHRHLEIASSMLWELKGQRRLPVRSSDTD